MTRSTTTTNLDGTPFVDDADAVDEWQRVDEIGDVDEASSDHAEPRKSVVKRIAAVLLVLMLLLLLCLIRLGLFGGGRGRGRSVSATASSAASSQCGLLLLLLLRHFRLVVVHVAHQLQALAQLLQRPEMRGAVLLVRHLHRHHAAREGRVHAAAPLLLLLLLAGGLRGGGGSGNLRRKRTVKRLAEKDELEADLSTGQHQQREFTTSVKKIKKKKEKEN